LSSLAVVVIVFFGYYKYSKNLDLNNKKMCGEQRQKLNNQLIAQNKESMAIWVLSTEMFYSNKKNTCISVEQYLTKIESASGNYVIKDYLTGETLDRAGSHNELLEILKKYKN